MSLSRGEWRDFWRKRPYVMQRADAGMVQRRGGAALRARRVLLGCWPLICHEGAIARILFRQFLHDLQARSESSEDD